MAQKNIVVAENVDGKLVLFPREREGGRKLDQATSKAIRAAVREDGRFSYNERLSANKRVGLKNGNALAKAIYGILGSTTGGVGEAPAPAVAAGPSIADLQAEAEARNAKYDAAVTLLNSLGIEITAEKLAALV